MPGTLFVVATPIGNLEDITFRAVRTLREVDVVAAEDTRRTAKLLAHYEIRKPMVSLREHNETRESPRLVDRIGRGESVALVSDAGTPGISDPGMTLVRLAHEAGLRVVPIPGPSAVTAALSASGFSADRFVFMGFPPSTGAARLRWLERLRSEPGAVVFYESPHRIRRLVEEVMSILATRPIYVFRELTKIHENLVILHNTLAGQIPERGEFVGVVGPRGDSTPIEPDPILTFRISECLSDHLGLEAVEVQKLLAGALGVEPRAIPKLLKNGRYLVKQQNEKEP